METDKLKDIIETKTNGGPQVITVEMGDPIHRTNARQRTTSESKNTGYCVTLMHLIKGNIGCGMLAMGEAFKFGGLFLTLFILLYVWLITVYNMHVLISLSKKMQNRLQCRRAPSFGETVENSFKTSDKKIFRNLSPIIGKVVLYNIFITQLGLCSAYIIFIGRSLKELIFYRFRENIEFQYILLLTMPLIMVCASLRKLRFIAPLSTFANFALITGVTTILYYSCSDLHIDDNIRYTYKKWSELPMMFGIIMFSFEGIGLVLPLFAEIKDDHKFTSCFGALNLGMFAVMMLNVPLGMTGYMKWGEEVKSSLTLNLSYEQPLTQFVILMMILGIACSYALQFYPAAVIVYSDLNQYFGPFNRPLVWDYSIRICICLFTYIAASTVPHLDLFMSLVGSVTCVALTMLFPALSNLAARKKNKSSKLSTFLDMVTIITAVIGSITGIYANSMAIYNAFTNEQNND